MRLIQALVFGVQLSAVFALPAPKEAKSATKSTAAATTSAAAKAGETEGAKNELNVTGTFGTAVALGGGNVKTDVLFTKSVSFLAATLLNISCSDKARPLVLWKLNFKMPKADN